MSYHRGGHPGAVAVSYSTSTMAPLSPSRRYSGSNGTSSSGTSSTTGSSTSKYFSRPSGGDRTGSYYSSASISGFRTSSFTSSTDSYRRPYISPARSVSSYNESGSIVGSSSVGSRYGSASSSSASSTASSTSSSASRDRNGLNNPTPASLATSTADLYAKYSPTNYVPNIYGSSINNTSSTIGNGHWRPSSSNSSSGNSSNILAELHSIDDYDSCRDRRGRSFSRENSSGIGVSTNSTTANSKINVVSPSLAERWSTRREAKRRTTPVTGSGSTVITGHAQNDSVAAPIEVTLNNGKNDISSSNNSRSSSNSSSGSDRRAAATTSGVASLASSLLLTKIKTDNVEPSLIDEIIIDSNVNNDNNTENNDVKTDSRDIDNNNAQNNNNNKNNDRDLILESDSSGLEQRRRRRRFNAEQQLHNGQTDDREDNNETKNINKVTVVARNNRDFNDESNCSERKNIIAVGSTSVDSCLNHHHSRVNATDESRESVVSVSVIKVVKSDGNLSKNVVNNDVAVVTSSSSSASSLSSSTSSETFNCSATFSSTPAVVSSNGEPNDILNCVETKIKSLESSVTSSVANSSDGGGGCAGGDADHHRTAYTWTKLPTNPDNTELLTNNNGQDREAAVLGIVDTGKNSDNSATTSTGKIRERTTMVTSGTRKSLLWTATNEIEGDSEPSNENFEGNDGKNVRKSSILKSGLPVVIKNSENENSDDCEVSNGLVNEEDNGEESSGTLYDFNRGESNGITLRINGVTERPSGTRSDDPGKPSTSRRTVFGWNDQTIDDLTATSSSASASSSTATSNSVPVAVHQNLYRGLNEQIDESSNSRPTRNRLQSRRDERYGLNGLRNIGNTCFMNSVIQCLSNTRPLLEYLLNEQHLHDINTTTSSMKGALIKAFGQVIHELWDLSGDHVVNTTALKSQIQRFAPRFMGYSQQDAQEFLRYLLEGLHEDVNRVTVKPQPILTDIPDHYSDSHKAAESWKRYLRSEDSTIVDVFVGQLRSSLCCTSCDHVSVTLDPFWDLSLPIPARSGTVKLNQCLEHFTKVETMDGDEKPTCSKCQMRRKCTKSFSIQKFPKILVIHLKRFSPTERFRGKLSVLVDFPLTGLDLSAFAAPGVQGCTYNLYGVANHSGTTYSGHYTAYCKHPYSGEWHEYNDNRVSSVPARSVVSSEAYVLFYEQQPLNPHL